MGSGAVGSGTVVLGAGFLDGTFGFGAAGGLVVFLLDFLLGLLVDSSLLLVGVAEFSGVPDVRPFSNNTPPTTRITTSSSTIATMRPTGRRGLALLPVGRSARPPGPPCSITVLDQVAG